MEDLYQVARMVTAAKRMAELLGNQGDPRIDHAKPKGKPAAYLITFDVDGNDIELSVPVVAADAFARYVDHIPANAANGFDPTPEKNDPFRHDLGEDKFQETDFGLTDKGTS